MAFVPETRPCSSCGAIIQKERAQGLFALTKLEKAATGKVTFFPSEGIPVVIFRCPNCNAITLYPARAVGEM